MKSVENFSIANNTNSAYTVKNLRKVILSCSNLIEEISTQNGISFYYNNFFLCALYNTPEGIELPINFGEKLIDSFNVLSITKGNQYKISRIKSSTQIDNYVLIGLIQQAMLCSILNEIEFRHTIETLSK